MNTSKRTQRPILLAIVAVLALAVLVSASVIFALATEPEQDTVYVSLDGRVNVVFNFVEPADSYTVKVGSEETPNVEPVNGSVKVALYPYQMTETIEVIKTGETAGKKISVVDYVKKILASSDSNVMKYQDSARALLNYGAMTQLAFDKDTSNLANAGIFTKGNPIDGVTSIAADPFEASGINGTINLILREGDIVLKYELTSEESFTATLDGEAIEFQSLGNNQYSFEIKNISVNDFAKKWTVVIDGATCERTVLQYLNYNIFDASSTASNATKDACRALYQLYQQTVDAAKPDQTACKHGNLGYWVPAEDGKSINKCLFCSAQIEENAIPDSVNAYISGEALAKGRDDKLSTDGYYVSNVSTVNEDIFLRELYYGRTSTKENDKSTYNTVGITNIWKDTNKTATIEIGDANFMVIRFKLKSATTNALTVSLGTTAYTYMDAHGNPIETAEAPYTADEFKDGSLTDSNFNQGSIYKSITITKSADDTWATYVIDLDAYNDNKIMASEGVRTIDTLKFTHTGDLSVEYIAFVNGWNEVKALVTDTYIRKVATDGTSSNSDPSTGEHAHINNDCDEKCDECGTDGQTASPCVKKNLNCDDRCDICGATVTDPGALVIDCGKLDTSKLAVTNGTASIEDDALHIALTEGATTGLTVTLLNSTTTKLNGQSELDIGNARYVMIKMKSDRTGTMNLQLSTTSDDTMQKFFTRGDSYTSTERNVYRIFIIDLNLTETEGSNNAGLTANTESRVLSLIRLFMGRTDGTEVDIDYIAFASDLSEAKKKIVADEDTALTVYNVPVWTNESTSANTVLDLSTIS